MKKSLITMLLGLTIILLGATILFHSEYKRCGLNRYSNATV